ncbi:hypothetical protein BTN50_2032 [Candidatus Enterovibrio altilux]|uniref:Mobile element protein n=1 Tax=Candidatus Enterovibrio altilux TaxID=1927128 RepID=A0A291BBW8_9GAMM|nr:hypothetical protein BTN50_2032 [Candidatus Enterovibrio luxaltus]
MKKYSIDGKWRIYHKLHLVVDMNTHEIIATELSASKCD